MREMTSIIIHCADTPNGSEKYTVRDIDAWHAARAFRREGAAIAQYNGSYPYIGYHEVIDVNGKCWMGRGENEVGAHATGPNAHSLAVCLLGRDKYTLEQWEQRNEAARLIDHCATASPSSWCAGLGVG